MKTKVEPTVEPKSVVVGYEPVNENSPLSRSYEHIKVQPILDSIQVEPTVEGLDRLIDELWSIKFQSMNKDEFDNEVRTLISLFQSHSVQEAKAEGAREILRDIDNLQISCAKADGVIDGITALHQLRVDLLASLKQEEEL